MTTATTRGGPQAGRPAVQELAELLLLRRRPAAVAIGGVLLVGLLLALLGILPATPLMGLVTGLVALLVALGAMLATDAIDPVVRGPRHVRVSGRTVLGRVPAEPLGRDLREPVDQLVAALQRTRHLRVVVVGVGQDARPVAEGLARGTAAAGHSALLVDCGDTADAQGISDAGGDGLARVVRIDEQIRMASTGAGSRPDDAIAAAARLAATPPSDLDLLVTVLPDGATPPAGLLAHTERLIAVVPLDVLGRDELDRRLSQVEGTRSTSASVVVVDLAESVRPVATPPSGQAPVVDEPPVEAAVPVDADPGPASDRATDRAAPGGDGEDATPAPMDTDPVTSAGAEPEDDDGPPPFRGSTTAAADLGTAAAASVGAAASDGARAVRSALASLAGRVEQRTSSHRRTPADATPAAAADRAAEQRVVTAAADVGTADVGTADVGTADDVDAPAVDAPAVDAAAVDAPADDAAAVEASDADGPMQIVDVTDDAAGEDADDTAPLELPTIEHDDDLALRTAAALELLAEDGALDR